MMTIEQLEQACQELFPEQEWKDIPLTEENLWELLTWNPQGSDSGPPKIPLKTTKTA